MRLLTRETLLAGAGMAVLALVLAGGERPAEVASPAPKIALPAPSATVADSALPADLARDFTPKTAVARKLPPWPVTTPNTGFGIVGGQLADYDDHPGAVALEIVSEERGKPDEPGWRRAAERCGGTALTRDWIVTAAHCLEGDWLRVDVFYGHASIRAADGSICREPGYEATFAGARVVGG